MNGKSSQPSKSIKSKESIPPNAPQQKGQTKQMGEGSYEASEDYQKSIKSYLDKADVKADADAAKPANQAEAREMQDAEKEGLSHSKARGQ